MINYPSEMHNTTKTDIYIYVFLDKSWQDNRAPSIARSQNNDNAYKIYSTWSDQLNVGSYFFT